METSLYRIISEIFDVHPGEISPQVDFYDDLGASRQDMQRLQQQLSVEYDILIPDEELDQIKKVHDAITYIKENG